MFQLFLTPFPTAPLTPALPTSSQYQTLTQPDAQREEFNCEKHAPNQKQCRRHSAGADVAPVDKDTAEGAQTLMGWQSEQSFCLPEYGLLLRLPSLPVRGVVGVGNGML